jgi:hypothetical protein
MKGDDLVWLNDKTCVVGLDYQTNEEVICQPRDFLGLEYAVELGRLIDQKGAKGVFRRIISTRKYFTL